MFGYDDNGDPICQRAVGGVMTQEQLPEQGGMYFPGDNPGHLATPDELVARILLPMSQQLYMGATSEGKQNMPPFFQLLIDRILPFQRELHQHYTQQALAHQKTLQVLARVCSGELKPSQVAATDEGWKIRRQRRSQGSENGHAEEVSIDANSAVGAAS